MRTEMRARDGGGGGGGVEDPPANTTKWGYFEMGAPKWTRRGVSKWHGCQIASYRTSGISAFSVYSYGTTFFCAVGIGESASPRFDSFASSFPPLTLSSRVRAQASGCSPSCR